MASETAFLVDFLPVIRRTVTRSGFVIDHVQYYCDALKPWIARREQLGRFVLRRDPRDISRIWALDPDGGAYLEVPYRTLSRPPISAWEQKAAVDRLLIIGIAVFPRCPHPGGPADVAARQAVGPVTPAAIRPCVPTGISVLLCDQLLRTSVAQDAR